MEHKIGEVIYKKDPILINDGLDAVEITVRNSGDRCIQVCSHYHFFESNLALEFEREKAFGRRLDIPAGTAVRFEPGESKRVSLVQFRGNQTAIGFLGITMGDTKAPTVKEAALKKLDQLVKGGR